MNCPRCEHTTSRVLESRVTDAGDAMRRRRECLECSNRFTTYERIEMQPLWIAKSNGTTEQFDREKLLRGLARACNKRNVQIERLEALVIEIEAALRSEYGKDVTSDAIGERALDALRRIDDVAYVRFASVYRAFENIDEFQLELDRMERTGFRALTESDLTTR